MLKYLYVSIYCFTMQMIGFYWLARPSTANLIAHINQTVPGSSAPMPAFALYKDIFNILA